MEFRGDLFGETPQWMRQRLPEPILLVPRRLRNPTPTYEGMLYSAIPHPLYPVDPRLVAAIRESDPGFIPLWVSYLFRDPPDGFGLDRPVRVYVRHAIARHIPQPLTRKPPYQVLMPPDAPFPMPNQIDRILGGCKDKTLPEPYEPLTWDSYYRPWRRASAKEVEAAFVDAPIEAAARQREYEGREMAGLQAELDAYVNKKWAQVSTPEIAQAIERQRWGIPLNWPDDRANELLTLRKRQAAERTEQAKKLRAYRAWRREQRRKVMS